MAIQIKFKINMGTNNNNGIRPERIGTTDKGRVKLAVEGNYVCALKSGGNDGDVVRGTDNLKRSDAAHTDIQANTITHFQFTADLKEISRLARLLCLRESLKDTAGGNNDKGATTIVVREINTGDADLHLPIATATGVEVEFEDKHFTGSKFEVEKVAIGIFKNTGGGVTAGNFKDSDLEVDLSNHRTTWKTLEDLLEKLKTDYAVDDAKNLKDAEGAGADTIEKDITALVAYETAGAGADSPAKKLWELDHVSVVDEVTGNYKDGGTWYQNQIKWWITHLREFKVWKQMGVNKITDILRINANGFIISKRGYTGTDCTPQVTFGEADANGAITNNAKHPTNSLIYTETEGKANIDYLKDSTKPFTISGGKYRGVSVCEATQTIEDLASAEVALSSVNNSYVISQANGNLNLGYLGKGSKMTVSKDIIDNFLDKDIWFGKLGETTYNDSKTLKQRRGLKLTDFRRVKRANVRSAFITGHGSMNFEDASKFGAYDESTGAESTTKDQLPTYLCGIVQSAPTIQAALDLAFFAQGYFKTNSKYLDTDRWEGTDKGKIKYKLFLDEVESMSKLDHLKLYYGWLLNRADIGSLVYEDAGETFSGTDWPDLAGATPGTTNNFCNNTGTAATDPRGLAQAAYQEVKKFVELATQPYNDWAKGGSSPDKSKLEKMKTDLEAVKNKKGTATDLASCSTNEQKVAFVWESEINTRITALDGMIAAFIPGTPNMPDDARKVLDDAKTAEADNSDPKKFYDNLLTQKATDDKITKDVAEKIKAIVEAVKKVMAGNASEADCNALKELKTKGESGSEDEKKAWTVATEIEVESKKWVEEAVTKADNRINELREAAHNKLKTATGGGDNEIYKAISAGIENNISVLEAAAELFTTAKSAWGLASKLDNNYETLKNTLTAAKDNDAWKAVNNWKKDKDNNAASDGFAAGALKKLLEFKDKANKGKKDIEVATTPEAARKVWEEDLDEDTKKNIDERELKGRQIYLKLKDSSDSKEKELANVFLSMDDASDRYKNEPSVLDNSLTEITKVINILKKYDGKTANASGSEEEKTLAKLKNDISKFGEPKDVINFWLTKLETQQKVLKKAQEERDKNKKQPESEKTPWYKTTVAYVAYSVLAVGAVVGLGWLAFKGGGEEEGNE